MISWSKSGSKTRLASLKDHGRHGHNRTDAPYFVEGAGLLNARKRDDRIKEIQQKQAGVLIIEQTPIPRRDRGGQRPRAVD